MHSELPRPVPGPAQVMPAGDFQATPDGVGRISNPPYKSATDVRRAPVVEFDAVSKFYGNVIGVNRLTLRIPTGVTGLLRPNGAGKSTLLQLATGQCCPSQGTVRVVGRRAWNNPGLNRYLGLC